MSTVFNRYGRGNQAARVLWTQIGYGVARGSPKQPRLDVGTFKPRPGKTQRMFRKQRRAAVTKLAKENSTPALSATVEVEDNDWNDANILKEANFQEAKRIKRQIEAILDGSIDASTCSCDILELAVAEKHARAKNDKKRKGDAARKEAHMPLHKPKSSENLFKDVHVFCEANVDQTFDVDALKRANGFVGITADRCIAQVFVVTSFEKTKLGQRTNWAAGLLGGLVCTPSFFASGGQQGTALRYQRCISSRRHVHCTDGFKAAHGTVYAIIQTCASSKNSKWRLRDTQADCEASKLLKSCSGAQASALWIFCTAKEKKSNPVYFTGIRTIVTEPEARELISKIDKAKSFRGCCGV